MYPKCKAEVQSSINFVHSKRKGIFIQSSCSRKMFKDPIGLRNRISWLQPLIIRHYWTESGNGGRAEQALSPEQSILNLQPFASPQPVEESWLIRSRSLQVVRRSKYQYKVQPPSCTLPLFPERERGRNHKAAKMKLLESTRFEAINNALSITTGDSKIIGRFVVHGFMSFFATTRMGFWMWFLSLQDRELLL